VAPWLIADVSWRRGFDETLGFIGGGHRFLGWQPMGVIHATADTREP
jgi:hypothetical protein